MQQRLELNSCFFTISNISAVQEFDQILTDNGPNYQTRLDVSISVRAAPENKDETDPKAQWVVVLMLETVEDESLPVMPYKASVTAVGSFTLSGEIPKEDREEFAAKHGGAILYGAAREHIANVTGRMVFGAHFIPTTTFVDLAKSEIPAKAGKPKKKGK